MATELTVILSLPGSTPICEVTPQAGDSAYPEAHMRINSTLTNPIARATAIAVLLAPLALTGCGSSQPGRLSGGAAGGAATGAVFGIIGGPIGVVVGAGIGAGVGALTSTSTTPKQVNLGNPPWQKGDPKTAENPPAQNPPS